MKCLCLATGQHDVVQRISDWFRKRHRLSGVATHGNFRRAKHLQQGGHVLRVAGWKYCPFLDCGCHAA